MNKEQSIALLVVVLAFFVFLHYLHFVAYENLSDAIGAQGELINKIIRSNFKN